MDKRINRLGDSELELVNGGAGCGVDDKAVRRDKKDCSECGEILPNNNVIDDRMYGGLSDKDKTKQYLS